MGKPDLYLFVEYDMKNESAKLNTNIKHEMVAEVLGDYLHSRVGSGKDPSEPAQREIYTIKLGLELDGDVWYCEHDCGNKGLREGILMSVLKMLHDQREKITWAD